MSLNKRKLDFIEHYMANGYNATQAYMAVFPNAAYHTARTGGYQMCSNEEVKAEIERRKKLLYESLNISAERIAEELATMAFAEKGDREYNASIKIKAIDLLQKQLGLQTQKVNADIDKTTIVISIDEDKEAKE